MSEKLVFKAEDFEECDGGRRSMTSREGVIAANRIFEAWLARQVVVEGNVEFDCWSSEMDKHPEAHMNPTHRARLVCVEELREDTAESLLRKMIKCWELETSGQYSDIARTARIVERARKLLSEGE